MPPSRPRDDIRILEKTRVPRGLRRMTKVIRDVIQLC